MLSIESWEGGRGEREEGEGRRERGGGRRREEEKFVKNVFNMLLVFG